MLVLSQVINKKLLNIIYNFIRNFNKTNLKGCPNEHDYVYYGECDEYVINYLF